MELIDENRNSRLLVWRAENEVTLRLMEGAYHTWIDLSSNQIKRLIEELEKCIE